MVLRGVSMLGFIGFLLVTSYCISRYFGSLTGLITGLILSIAADLRVYSVIAHPDTMALFCMSASFFALLEFASRGDLVFLAQSGLAGGLAMASKYSALLLVPYLVIGLYFGVRRSFATGKDCKEGCLGHLSVYVIAISLVACVVLLPQLVTYTIDGIRADQSIATEWQLRDPGAMREMPAADTIIGSRYFPILQLCLALLAVVVAVAGVGLSWGRFARAAFATRAFALWVVAFVLAVLVASPEVLKSGRMLRGMLSEASHVSTGHEGHESRMLDWLIIFFSTAQGGFGLLAAGSFVFALIVCLSKRMQIRVKLDNGHVLPFLKVACLGTLVVLAYFLLRVEYRAPRYLFVLLPAVAVATAFAVRTIICLGHDTKVLLLSGIAIFLIIDVVGSLQYSADHADHTWPSHKWQALVNHQRRELADLIRSKKAVSHFYAYAPDSVAMPISRRFVLTAADVSAAEVIVVALSQVDRGLDVPGRVSLEQLETDPNLSVAYRDEYQVCFVRGVKR